MPPLDFADLSRLHTLLRCRPAAEHMIIHVYSNLSSTHGLQVLRGRHADRQGVQHGEESNEPTVALPLFEEREHGQQRVQRRSSRPQKQNGQVIGECVPFWRNLDKTGAET